MSSSGYSIIPVISGSVSIDGKTLPVFCTDSNF